MRKLEGSDPRRAEIVMLRCFGGLSEEQTAAGLDVSVRTIGDARTGGQINAGVGTGDELAEADALFGGGAE